MNANLANIIPAEYSDNILPYASTFDESSVIINKTAGTAGSSASYDDSRKFSGAQSIHLINDSSSTELQFNLGTALGHEVTQAGKYRVSLRIMQDQNPLSYIPFILTLNVSLDGVVIPDKEIVMTLPTEDDDNPDGNLIRDLFYTFEGWYEIAPLDVPTVVDYTFTFDGVDTTLGDAEIWIDGFKAEYVDRIANYNGCTAYTRPKNELELLPTATDGNYVVKVDSNTISYNKILEASATLDFPSTLAGAVSDLTIALTGAVVGQTVELGIPASTVGVYTAFVSAADTVTVRFNNTTAGTVDPASGTFTVKIIQ